MPAISFCFNIHQPYRFKSYGFNDIGKLHSYEDTIGMIDAMNNLADNCYLPANKIILEQVKKTRGRFRIAFSISGTALELFQQYRPDVIKSFAALVNTGCVEILGETFYNSLSWLHSKIEFIRQVKKHDDLVKELFGVEPVIFRNTELLYDNELAKHVAGMGYKGIMSEAHTELLKGRSPNQTYAAPGNGDFGILLRNGDLSDDIACLYGIGKGSRYALTAEKFAERVFHNYPQNSCNINISFDYETFGIYKKAQTGMFKFLEELPAAILSNPKYRFKTPTEALDHCYPKDIYDVPEINSVDNNTDWCNNVKQNDLLKKLYRLERLVTDSDDQRIINTWGKLQSAEHYYFIKGHQHIGDSYQPENPLRVSVEGYQQFVNIITDFEISLMKNNIEKNRSRFSHQLSSMLF